MTDTHLTDQPTPGSGAARGQGCLCPVVDNHHGAGFTRGGRRLFIRHVHCPLHGRWPRRPQTPDSALPAVRSEGAG